MGRRPIGGRRVRPPVFVESRGTCATDERRFALRHRNREAQLPWAARAPLSCRYRGAGTGRAFPGGGANGRAVQRDGAERAAREIEILIPSRCFGGADHDVLRGRCHRRRGAGRGSRRGHRGGHRSGHRSVDQGADACERDAAAASARTICRPRGRSAANSMSRSASRVASPSASPSRLARRPPHRDRRPAARGDVALDPAGRHARRAQWRAAGRRHRRLCERRPRRLRPKATRSSCWDCSASKTTALALLLEQVSVEQHRLENERRQLANGIRASQEASLLETAVEASLSLAQTLAHAESAESEQLRAAIDSSLAAKTDDDSRRAAEASEIESVLRRSAHADSAGRRRMPSSRRLSLSRARWRRRRSSPAARPRPRGGRRGRPRAAGEQRGERSKRRSRAARACRCRKRRRRQRAAAASRGAVNGGGGGGGGGGEVQYRSDSIRRVYEAQHRFVLAQLTAPGVEAFLADDDDDDDDDDDEGGGSGKLSRSASKFV